MGIARLITDNLGGVTGSFRVGQLADTFGIPCTPHNWSSFFDMAAALQPVHPAVPTGPCSTPDP
jgi:L-alanine-DL-glutamate epimerase-like enolase superfamily enzyme